LEEKDSWVVDVEDSGGNFGRRWFAVKPEFIPVFSEGGMLFWSQRFAKEQTMDEFEMMDILVWMEKILRGRRVGLGLGGQRRGHGDLQMMI
jgi:hypothetical protein